MTRRITAAAAAVTRRQPDGSMQRIFACEAHVQRTVAELRSGTTADQALAAPGLGGGGLGGTGLGGGAQPAPVLEVTRPCCTPASPGLEVHGCKGCLEGWDT